MKDPEYQLDEEDSMIDLEVFCDIIIDDSYHYAKMLRAYHTALLTAISKINETLSK